MTLTPQEEEAFLLCFVSSFWKRSIRCMYLYCQIKFEEKQEQETRTFQNPTSLEDVELQDLRVKTEPNAKLLLKCIKYNLFAPTGAYNRMKKYLEKIYSTGFLLPREFRKEELVNRAISLFSRAYLHVKDAEFVEPDYNKFTYDFAYTVSSDSYDYEFDEKEEILKTCDTTDSLRNSNSLTEKQFCNLIDSWDICPSLFFVSEDIIQERFVIMLNKTIIPE